MSERDGTGTRSRSADAGVAGLTVTKIVLGLTSRLLSFWTEMRFSPRVQFSSRPCGGRLQRELPGCPSAAGTAEWVPNVRPAGRAVEGIWSDVLHSGGVNGHCSVW